MENRNETVLKWAQTALLAALCFVAFTFLQIKIPMPGGDATSLHIGNAFCVLAALLLGGGIGIPPILQLAKELECEKSIVLGYRDERFLEEEFRAQGSVYIAT
ncbi:ECF transporter S component, partial [Parabacteroides distasonis]